jgi:hypothetical protein
VLQFERRRNPLTHRQSPIFFGHKQTFGRPNANWTGGSPQGGLVLDAFTRAFDARHGEIRHPP